MSLFTNIPTPLVEEGGRKGNMALYKALVNKFPKILYSRQVRQCTLGSKPPWLYSNRGRSCGIGQHPKYLAH